jgi:glutathione S-transferase
MSNPPGLATVDLFGLERSVYTRIARLALEEKGVAYTLHEVEIFGPAGVPPEHRRRHPFGRIPVLRHGDFELYETIAITHYVDEAFEGLALQARTPESRARGNQIIGLLDSYAYRPMVWGVFVERISAPASGRRPNENRIAASMLAAEPCLAELTRLARFEPFLLGSELTLADLHTFPMLRYFVLTADGRGAVARYPALQTWMETMDSRASVVRTRSSHETRVEVQDGEH